MTAAGKIKGDREIRRKLSRLGSSSAVRRVVRAGQSKAMTVLSRGIRNAVPPKYKSAKKTIGRNTKKGGAKVGFGVGKQKASMKQRDPKNPGVGIAKQNIHWLIFGTGPRPGRGRMPNIGEAGQWLKRGVRSVEKEAMSKMKEQMRKKLAEEERKA